MDYPKIRAIEAFPVKENLICLRDPLMFSDKMLMVPHNVFFIISLLDGRHSILDIQAEYTRRYGELLFSEKVREIVTRLDDSLFLENDRFRERRANIIDAFKLSEVRKCTHAGSAFAEEPIELKKQLDGILNMQPKAFSGDGEQTNVNLKGLIAPHIDLHRGGNCYAFSYRELARVSKADIFVVLGISHAETERKYVLTKKDFQTPLGTCCTDRALVDSIQQRCSYDFFSDEFVHLNEHSIEFQVLFLQHIFAGHREIKIVPILCASFHTMILNSTTPGQNDEVKEFLAALQEATADHGDDICIVAGVDLSHVGQRFGQDVTITSDLLKEIEEQDHAMLKHVLSGDGESFFRFIQQEKDRRNVCGVSAIYALLSTIVPENTRLLRYEQAVDQTANSVVTFAGMAFYE